MGENQKINLNFALSKLLEKELNSKFEAKVLHLIVKEDLLVFYNFNNIIF